MNTDVPSESIALLVAAVAQQRYAQSAAFFSTSLVAQLRAEACALESAKLFRPGTIASGLRKPELSIRSDNIAWFDKNTAQPGQLSFLLLMEELRLALNRELQLGAFEFECHFTAYPPGAFYRRHMDQARGKSQRVVSCIAYLNPDWQTSHGGELRIFSGDTAQDTYIDIAPKGCTLVSFLSEGLYHEVRPTTVDRYAIAGWFRTRET